MTHTERVVDGRTGYVWEHRLRNGAWYSTTWFPQPVHTVRLECVGRRQTDRFKRLVRRSGPRRCVRLRAG